MPAGSAVVRYDGKNGTVWRIKFTDAEGSQVMETLGKSKDGWTKRRARAELRARENDVKRAGLTRPKPETFEAFVSAGEQDGKPKDAWVEEHCNRRGLK